MSQTYDARSRWVVALMRNPPVAISWYRWRWLAYAVSLRRADHQVMSVEDYRRSRMGWS